MPRYYLHRDGENHGPYPIEQLKQLIDSGEVAPHELICQEGGEEWLPASSLMSAARPVLVTRTPVKAVQAAGARVPKITQEQIAIAYQKIKSPVMGILFSAGLPFVLWAAKSDAERGVRPARKYRALQELAANNTHLLPYAIAIGVVGIVACSIWFVKTLKRAKALKAEYQKQQPI